MNNITQGLNTEQEKAVEYIEGTLLVLAGAGSGKTKVLTSRIANLVQHGASPYEILAVTFTNKAANEMRERLGKIIGEEVVKKMWVGTFHNICGRILRMDLDKYKTQKGQSWNNNYVIYAEDDSNAVIKAAIKKFGLDDKIYTPKLVKSIISNAKSKMQNAAEFEERARDHRSRTISQIYNEYEKALITNNALDFDDMLMLAVNLLRTNDEVREKYAERFKHILVDEFQDTNAAQYDLIKMLYKNEKPRSLCVVGDVDQSIYSWRGADFKIILNFQNDFKETALIKLEKNYRSTECILEAANYIIRNNTQRIERNLYSQKGKGEIITGYQAEDEASEAYWVTRSIWQNKYNHKDVAILYRTNAQSRSLEESCISRGIPYKIIGGLRFYERKEIKDIVAYLRLIYNNPDSQALKRIINVPKRSIGATTIKKLTDLADNLNLSPYETIDELERHGEFNSKTKKLLTDFKGLIEELKMSANSLPVSEFIAHVLERSGYLAELREENCEEADTRIENLQEFINAARDFETSETENTLADFLSQIALVSDVDQLDEGEHITLMTLHAAKGLEFPIVYLCGLEEGIFPHSRTFQNNTELEEERRLMYVGVTRAKDKLYISWAKRRQVWGEYRNFEPSRFLEEIPEELMEKNTSLVKSEKTFKSAVERIRSTGSFGRDFKPPSSSSSYSGQTNRPLSNNLGKSFTPPKPKSAPKPPPPKKVSDIIANLKSGLNRPNSTLVNSQFKSGDRVFHEKFGIGSVKSLQATGSSTLYTIDFGKFGEKSLDSQFANLKKF